MNAPNPYKFAADQLLSMLDPNSYHTGYQFGHDAQILASQLGLTCDVSRMDNGTLALILVLGLMREYGEMLATISGAHNHLHEP